MGVRELNSCSNCGQRRVDIILYKEWMSFLAKHVYFAPVEMVELLSDHAGMAYEEHDIYLEEESTCPDSKVVEAYDGAQLKWGLGNAPSHIWYLDWMVHQCFHGRTFGAAVDIGCGIGMTLPFLHQIGVVSGEITQVDESESALIFARITSDRIGVDPKLVRSLATSVPLESGAYDFVLSKDVLHWSREWQSILDECVRLLERGGVFCLIYQPESGFRRAIGATPVEVERFLRDSGMSIIDVYTRDSRTSIAAHKL